MIDRNDQILARQAKLTAILASGKNAYPHHYKLKQTVKEMTESYEKYQGELLQSAGRIMKIMGKGKISFIRISDDGREIQLVCSRDRTEDYAGLKLLDRGDYIAFQGRCFITQTGEKSIEISRFEILSKSLNPLPFPKKTTDTEGNNKVYDDFSNKEIRYRKRTLDLILNEKTRDTFIIRAKVISSVREYLDSRGYLEVETPILQNQYGGADARPFTSRINSLNMNVYLRISNELSLKRCIMGGFNRVYEIGKDFRNEGIDRTHNPEFTMIEFYETEGIIDGSGQGRTGG